MAARRERVAKADLDAAKDRIKHVVVLMLENRSFDHMLGYLDHPNGDPFPAMIPVPNPYDLDVVSPKLGPKYPTPTAGPNTVLPSCDAEPKLQYPPPHGHASAMIQMQGTGADPTANMNGFVKAYSLLIKGEEHIPTIHWELVIPAALGAAAIAGVAAEQLVARLELGQWGDFPVLPLLGGWAALGAIAWRQQLGRFLERRPWQIAVATGAAALVGTSFVDALHHGGRPVARASWIGAAAGLTALRLKRAKQTLTQRARVPEGMVPEASAKVMRCMDPATIPVLSELAREFGVCTRWFSSVPGATWPNRNFLHAGTSDGSTDIEIGLYDDDTIFNDLVLAGNDWRIYFSGMPQSIVFTRLWDRKGSWRALNRFKTDAENGDLPAYTFIEPDHDGADSNSQHPGNNQQSGRDFIAGEHLIRDIYNAIWDPESTEPPTAEVKKMRESTMLVITYDEHGGLFDHEKPPTADPPEGKRAQVSWTRRLVSKFVEVKNKPFDFKQLGMRVPTVLVSPWIKPGRVIGSDPQTETFDHTSVLATLADLFGMKPRLKRAEKANAFWPYVLEVDTPRDMPSLPPPLPLPEMLMAARFTETRVSMLAEAGPERAPSPVANQDADLIAQLHVAAGAVNQELDRRRPVTERVRPLATVDLLRPQLRLETAVPRGALAATAARFAAFVDADGTGEPD